MVPTRASCGTSGSLLRPVGALTIADSAATAAGGGRRDGEKIGRSRVVDNCVNGIAHSGLALSARSGAGAVGGATTRTVVTGGATGTAVTADPAARASSRPASRTSSEPVDFAASAAWRDSSSNAAPMKKLRIIWLPAIALRRPAEFAIFRLPYRPRQGPSGPRVDRRTG